MNSTGHRLTMTEANFKKISESFYVYSDDMHDVDVEFTKVKLILPSALIYCSNSKEEFVEFKLKDRNVMTTEQFLSQYTITTFDFKPR